VILLSRDAYSYSGNNISLMSPFIGTTGSRHVKKRPESLLSSDEEMTLAVVFNVTSNSKADSYITFRFNVIALNY